MISYNETFKRILFSLTRLSISDVYFKQEDEIKKLNEIILNAKCHAIRDAQLREKKEIYSELDHENKRLDEMMEIERLRALQQYEQREMERQYKQVRNTWFLL